MPRRVQHLTGRAVDITVGGAGGQGLPRGALGGEDEVVEIDLPVGGRGPDDEGAADLAAVAAVVGAEADGEEISFLDPAVGRPVAASARVRAGGDGGREGGAVGAVVDEPPFQFEGEMAFGAAD